MAHIEMNSYELTTLSNEGHNKKNIYTHKKQVKQAFKQNDGLTFKINMSNMEQIQLAVPPSTRHGQVAAFKNFPNDFHSVDTPRHFTQCLKNNKCSQDVLKRTLHREPIVDRWHKTEWTFEWFDIRSQGHSIHKAVDSFQDPLNDGRQTHFMRP